MMKHNNEKLHEIQMRVVLWALFPLALAVTIVEPIYLTLFQQKDYIDSCKQCWKELIQAYFH